MTNATLLLSHNNIKKKKKLSTVIVLNYLERIPHKKDLKFCLNFR